MVLQSNRYYIAKVECKHFFRIHASVHIKMVHYAWLEVKDSVLELKITIIPSSKLLLQTPNICTFT